MKRVKMCCFILVFLVFVSLGALWVINFNCQSLENQIIEIQQLNENKKTTLALEKTEQLNRSWNTTYKVLSCLVRHEKLSDINSSIARIKPYLESNNDELDSELNSALFQIDLLRKTEIPYLHNIL